MKPMPAVVTLLALEIELRSLVGLLRERRALLPFGSDSLRRRIARGREMVWAEVHGWRAQTAARQELLDYVAAGGLTMWQAIEAGWMAAKNAGNAKGGWV